MIIRLQDVPATGKDYRGEEPAEIVDVGEEVGGKLLSPITFQLHAVRVAGSLIVTGVLSAQAELHCARCDATFQRRLEDREFDRAWELSPDGLQWLSRMDEEAPEPPKKGEKKRVLARPEGGGGRDCVDLTEDIREAIILAFSGYPVCRPDCKGLCPACRVNLNEAACRCVSPEDNRWGMLDKLGAQ